MCVIPTINFIDYSSGDRATKQKFCNDLGKAFVEFGFVTVANHGISNNLINNFFKNSEAFFSLPIEVKKKYEVKGLAGQRGYTSFGKEHAKGFDLPDLKEFFQFGQENLTNSSSLDVIPKNIKVNELPSFSSLGVELFKEFERVGFLLLEAIAVFLEIETDYFTDKIAGGNSILRSIYYPPIKNDPIGAVRSEQHEDINLITLLVGASAGGLQVLTKEDKWLDLIPGENEIAINVGDMLQRLTNNYLSSTTHRVVNPPKSNWETPRISIPFFLHPKPEMDLSALDKYVKIMGKLNYEPITAGEYLDQRLKEIGLKK